MTGLTSLDDCLARALAGVTPVASEVVPLSGARGGVLAEALCFPADTPPLAEALRAGFAVTALDLTGASAGLPIGLAAPVHVLPGDPMPPGTDAVLPPEGVEATGTGFEAVRPPSIRARVSGAQAMTAGQGPTSRRWAQCCPTGSVLLRLWRG